MALSANNLAVFKPSGESRVFVVASGSTIYAGALVMIGLDGYAAPASNDLDFTASDGYWAGVALDKVVGDGTLTVEVDTGGGEILTTHNTGSLTIANVGDTVGVLSDNTVDALNSSTDIVCGKIAEVHSATSITVKLFPFGVTS